MPVADQNKNEKKDSDNQQAAGLGCVGGVAVMLLGGIVLVLGGGHPVIVALASGCWVLGVRCNSLNSILRTGLATAPRAGCSPVSLEDDTTSIDEDRRVFLDCEREQIERGSL